MYLGLDATEAPVSNLSTSATLYADRVWIGDNFPEDSQYWNSPIAEIVLLKTGGTTNAQKLQGYLAHKWGLTAKLNSGHPYKSSPPLLNIEVNNWINAVVAAGGSVTSTTQAAVDNFVTGCKSDGIWTKLSGGLILPFASDDFSGVFVPLAAPSGATLTNNNFLSSDYSLSTGLDPGASNTGKCITTNINFESLGSSTSIQISSYQRVVRSGTNTLACSDPVETSNRVNFHAGYSDVDYWDAFSVNSGGRINFSTGSAGLVSGSRTSGGSAIYRRGTERVSTTGSDGTFPTGKKLLIFACKTTSEGPYLCEKSVTSYFYAGPGLTSTEEGYHNARVQALQTALGRQV
jgi:hypothetical protein